MAIHGLLLALLIAVASRPAAAINAQHHEADPDFAAYKKFLRDWRPHAEERRRLNSHGVARFQIFKANLRKYEELQRRCAAGEFDSRDAADSFVSD